MYYLSDVKMMLVDVFNSLSICLFVYTFKVLSLFAKFKNSWEGALSHLKFSRIISKTPIVGHGVCFLFLG